MSDVKKPKIKRVSFGIPASQTGILGRKGLVMSPSTGQIVGEGGGLIVDPNAVGVDRVRITVDNGFGTSSELVTVKYLELLSPVIEPAAVTLNCKQNVDINWLPTGKFLTLGSGDRIRSVEWSAINLPDGIHLDTETGRLTGKIGVWGNFESSLIVQTNLGRAVCRLLWIVSPLEVCTISNSFGGLLSFSREAWSATYIWQVSPQGGTVRYSPPSLFLYYRSRATLDRPWSERKLCGPITVSYIGSRNDGESYTSLFFKLNVPACSNIGSGNALSAHFGTAYYICGSTQISTSFNCRFQCSSWSRYDSYSIRS